MIWQSWMIIPNVAKDSNDDLGGCRSHQYEKYELFLLLLVFTLRAVWCQWEWLSLIWSSYSCPAHLLIKPKCSLKTSHFRQSMEGTLRIILDCIMQSYCGWLWKYKHGSGCKWILVPFLLSSRVLNIKKNLVLLSQQAVETLPSSARIDWSFVVFQTFRLFFTFYICIYWLVWMLI